MSNDFYCDEVLSGRTSVDVVLETDDVLAFRHTSPFWPVHVVVIPKKHVPSLVDLGDADEALLSRVLAVVRQVAEQIVREQGGCRVGTNLGRYQDSKHLHFHVSAGEPLR
jgi:histidine triad (HIT) family protein